MPAIYILLFILLAVVAYLLWSDSRSAKTGGMPELIFPFLGGSSKSDKESKKHSTSGVKDVRKLTWIDDNNYVKLSYRHTPDDNSLLILYNNGKINADGTKEKGDIHIALKIDENGPDNRKQVEGLDKLTEDAKKAIKDVYDSLKGILSKKIQDGVVKELSFLA